MSLIDPNIASSGWETIAMLRGQGVLNTTVALEKAYSVFQIRTVFQGGSTLVYCRPNGDSSTSNYLQRGWYNSTGTAVTLYNITTDPGFIINYSGTGTYASVGEIVLYNPHPLGAKRDGTKCQSYVASGGNMVNQGGAIRWQVTDTEITSLQFVQVSMTPLLYSIYVSGVEA